MEKMFNQLLSLKLIGNLLFQESKIVWNIRDNLIIEIKFDEKRNEWYIDGFELLKKRKKSVLHDHPLTRNDVLNEVKSISDGDLVIVCTKRQFLGWGGLIPVQEFYGNKKYSKKNMCYYILNN